MLNVQELAMWAGAFMTIIGLIGFVVRPILKMMENLTKMGHSLDLLNRDLETSKSDRQALHIKWEKHEERLDAQDKQLVVQDQQLKTLFRGRG